jgi:hypothetical protein
MTTALIQISDAVAFWKRTYAKAWIQLSYSDDSGGESRAAFASPTSCQKPLEPMSLRDKSRRLWSSSAKNDNGNLLTTGVIWMRRGGQSPRVSHVLFASYLRPLFLCTEQFGWQNFVKKWIKAAQQ